MKDQKFDKIIGDKLRHIEAEPATGIFQNIIADRIRHGIFNNGTIKSWLIIATSIVLVSGWIMTNNYNKTEEFTQKITSEEIPSTDAVNTDKINNHQQSIDEKQKATPSEQKLSEKYQTIENKMDNKSKTDLVKSPVKENKSGLSYQSPEKPAVTQNRIDAVNLTPPDFSIRHFEGLIQTDYSLLTPDNNSTEISEIRKLSKHKSRLNEIELFYGFGAWRMNGLNEKMDESLSSYYYSELGVRLHLPVTKNINILTGLQWQKYQSRFDNSYNEKSTSTQIDTFNGVIIDPFGTPQSITRYDTSYNEVINTYSNSGKNQYTLINLPIGIEFSKPLKKGAVYCNLAVLVRINAVHKGFWLEDDMNEPIPVNIKGNTNQLTGDIGLSGGIGYLYHINPRLSLGLEPNFNLYSVSTLPTNMKSNGILWNFGLRTGLRYNF